MENLPLDMIPNIFEKTANVFTESHALGSLPDCASCYVIEERNGEYSLTLTYPLNGTNADLISNRRIITAKPSPYRDAQPFRIRRMSISKIGGLLTVYAEHISYDLSGYTFNMKTKSEEHVKLTYLDQLFSKMNAVSQCPFTFSTDCSCNAGIYFAPSTPKTLRDMCSDSTGSILDLQTSSGVPLKDVSTWLWNNYQCTLYGSIAAPDGTAIPSRGQTSLLDLDIVLGKNMSSLSASFDDAECYTHVKATSNNYYLNTTAENQNYDATFSSIYPEITGNEEAGSVRIKCVDTNEELDSSMDTDQMYQRMNDLAYQYYRQLNHEPSWSISVGYEDLNKAIGYRVWDESSNEYQYKDKAADLCDSVIVTYPPLGLVRERSYISKIKTDVIHERYAEITVGELSTALSRTLSRWR